MRRLKMLVMISTMTTMETFPKWVSV